MNFYQNQIWKIISKDIFKKDIFEYTLFWEKYWWIKKTHKTFWLKINWFQILGITIPDWTSEKQINYEINALKSKYKKFNNIFFQLWFINQIQEPYFENRQILNNEMKKKYKLQTSIKENMPLATVIVDLTKSEENIYNDFSKSAKRHIKKTIKSEIYFKIADQNEINDFYTLWSNTAKLKWFHIYPKNEYLKLIDFLKNTNSGNLYIVKKDNQIISWSIEINDKDNSYYLYWATNRDYIKLWGHYFLKLEMFKYLKNRWIKKVDLLWVSPTWYENHHLWWVNQFKHSLWWEHIEYFWNYDIVLNKLAYNLLKLKSH